MGLIRVVSPEQAGRFIDRKLTRVGVRERSPLGRLVRPGNIAASFGMRGPAEVVAADVSRVSVIEVVLIEAGTFPVKGSELFGDNKPAVENITMRWFYAAKYPVTVAEYREFTEDTGYLETIIGQQGAEDLAALVADRNKDRDPVRFVKRADRDAYVAWRSEKTEEHWFVLSAAQQEYMRRGSSGRTYPWGNDWQDPPYYELRGTYPVDVWPRGATPEGVSGIGIIREATSSYYGDYDPKIVKDPKGPETGKTIEVRGGAAWMRQPGIFFGVFRGNDDPDRRSDDVGFRLGKKLLSPESASLKR